MKNYLLAALVISLTACTSTEPNRIGDIAATPLRDFNLASTAIPPVLLEAKEKPYLAPNDQSCQGLALQIGVLDAVLDADLDVEVAKETGTARAKTALSNAAVGALQKTVEGAIPFRGWVRKLSGAERHSSGVAAAIAAGTARRAFLKGVAVGHACPPAQPMQAAA